MFKTLVYSPEVKVEIISRGVLYDISKDVVGGQVVRQTDTTSFANLRLANKDLRYSNLFRRMDRIQISFKRVSWVKVMTGYLDSVPVLQLYPGTVSISASCTIKRLVHTWWDPNLPSSQAIMNQRQADAEQTAAEEEKALNNGVEVPVVDPTSTVGSGNVDAGLGVMLTKILVEVGGWDEEQVQVRDMPTSFVDFLADNVDRFKNTEAVQKFKDLFGYDEKATMGGGGGLGNASFSTIRPPANGSSYTMEELVGITQAAGWSGEDAAIGAAIIMAESSGSPSAVNTANANGTVDRGLWQINSIHEAKLQGGDWFDPAVSTRMARQIYEEAGNSWQPWSTFSYFGSYQAHLEEARRALASGKNMDMTNNPSGSQKKSDPRSTLEKYVDSAIEGFTMGLGASPGGSADDSNINTEPSPAPQVGETGNAYNGKLNGKAPNTSQMRICDSIAAVALYAYPMMTYTSGERYTDNGNHAQLRAADISNGTDTTPEMQSLTQWWSENFLGKGLLELIHQPSQYNAYHDENCGDGMSIYKAGTMSEHRNHVHIAMSGVVSSDGTSTGLAGTAGANATGVNFDNRLGKSLFNYVFDPASNDLAGISMLFDGERAPVNDEPLLKTIKSICSASLRTFTSSPEGDFVAFYPDYFGIDGTEAVLKLEDVEMKDFHIDINDDALTTHVYVRGNSSSQFAGMSTTGEYGWLETTGIATVENEWLFKRLSEAAVIAPEYETGKEIMSRYGVRPSKQVLSNVTTPEMEFLSACQMFMQKWAEQFSTTVDFTFMPELFPGMRVEIVGHGITVYVQRVTHNFDYSGGFTTTATICAPAASAGSTHRIDGTEKSTFNQYAYIRQNSDTEASSKDVR